MMNTQEMNAYILTILEVLEKANTTSVLRGIPSGHLYAAMMGKVDFHTYNAMIAACKSSELITEHNFLLTITEKGSALVSQIRNILAKKSAQAEA